MNWSEILKEILCGKIVYRKGWNGKGCYVYKQVETECPITVIEKMTSLPETVRSLFLERNKPISFKNQMCFVDKDNVISSWVPSSKDLFADDWMAYEVKTEKETPEKVKGVVHKELLDKIDQHFEEKGAEKIWSELGVKDELKGDSLSEYCDNL